MTVSKNWEKFPRKQNFCLAYLLKRLNQRLFLTMAYRYAIVKSLQVCKMNDGPNEKNVFVLEKSNREN